MQEGCAPERAAIGECRGPFRGVENQLNFAVFDGIDDMRTALGDLVDLDRRNPLLGEVALGAGRSRDPEP